MIDKFPYPAKIPGGSRFPEDPDYTNYQELDEEPVDISANDFTSWGFYQEDERFARLTRVGMDKQNRCIIQRRYGELNENHRLEWIDYHFVVKRNILASCLAVAVMQGNNTFEKYCQMMERLDSLVPPTGNPEIDGPAPIVMTQERYNQLQKEKRERERKELEERKQRCAYFWDKVVWEDDECSLFFECDQPVMICHGKRFSFGYDGHEPMTIIYGDDVKYLHNGFDVGDECRYFLKNPQGTTLSITGRKYDAERFCYLLFAATTVGGESVSIDEAEKRLEEMMAYKKKKDQKNTLGFPYPAKKPGGCRFPASGTTPMSCFTPDEVSGSKRPIAQLSKYNSIRIHYTRESVCAADDYVNRDLEIKMPQNAVLSDLVEYIQHYHDDSGYSCIPYTGGGRWWALKTNNRILAYVNEDDLEGIRYSKYDRDTPLRSLNVAEVYGTRSF